MNADVSVYHYHKTYPEIKVTMLWNNMCKLTDPSPTINRTSVIMKRKHVC